MDILSLNIWDLPLWYMKNRYERLVRILLYLKKLNPDIICLQESFDPNHRKTLNSILKENGYYSTDAQVKSRHIFITKFDTTGGLITFSKFPIQKKVFIPFSRFNPSLIENMGRKGVLVAILNTPYGECKIVNTHLYQPQTFGQIVRLQQMKIMFDYLKKQELFPTIIAGDFNEHHIHIKPDFMNLFSLHEFFHPDTQERLDPSYRKENPYVNRKANRVTESKRIDYFFHNNLESLGIFPKQYRVLVQENALSDHEPVLLSLRSH